MLKLEKIEKVNNVNYLLLSDSNDFTTDYVSIELEKRGLEYLRLNRDLLPNFKITWNICNQNLLIESNEDRYLIENDSLLGVYYRAPTYLRETFIKNKSTEDQLKQSQWMSFYRNLLCFDNARWINSPSATFYAENKMIQLKLAKEIGFKIPQTILANNSEHIESLGDPVIIKSLDTAIFTINEYEAFVYTNSVSHDELKKSKLSIAPAIIQENLISKIDYRVTVIGNTVLSVKILNKGQGVMGDWRKEKDDVNFISCELPAPVNYMCCEIVKKLGLSFGAIDLIFYKNEFYFIEINPTGEWAWLVDSAGQKIYEYICDYMVS